MGQDWFDAHDGPKSLAWDAERCAFICRIGWNERCPLGVSGYDVEGSGKNPEEAIDHARRLKERFWD